MNIFKKINSFDFIKNKKIFFIIAAVIMVIGIFSFAFKGLNLDTDFVGGTTFTVNLQNNVDSETLDNISKLVSTEIGFDISSAQISNDTSVIIKCKEVDTDTSDKVLNKIISTYNLGEDFNDYSVTSIGASMSKDITNSLYKSIIIVILLMLVYITFRFQFATGLSAVICLAFNIFVMLSFYSLFDIPANSNLIAAVLTILGYSINAVIVIFDRMRENIKTGRYPTVKDAVNGAISQTFARSINTIVTTLCTLVMIYILGVQSIQLFALPLIIGVLAGLFSSVCLAGPLYVIILGNKKVKRK